MPSLKKQKIITQNKIDLGQSVTETQSVSSEILFTKQGIYKSSTPLYEPKKAFRLSRPGM